MSLFCLFYVSRECNSVLVSPVHLSRKNISASGSQKVEEGCKIIFMTYVLIVLIITYVSLTSGRNEMNTSG